MAKNSMKSNESFLFFVPNVRNCSFQFLKSKKPARKAVGPLGNKGIKEKFKENTKNAEKLNKFFA